MQETIAVRVASKVVAAEGVVRLELEGVAGPLPNFTAGAHIDVHLGGGLVRQYSLCDRPGRTDRYTIAVLHEQAGRGGSRYVHQALQAGDDLRISAPRNLFALAAGPVRHILIAGGIGITPILSMAQELSARREPFELHYCGRSRTRMAFVDLIAAAPWAGQAQLYRDDETEGFQAERVLREPAPATHVYVCGPPGFIDHVLTVANRLGWPAANLHREFFSAATPGAANATSAASAATAANTERDFEVELLGSGRCFRIPSGQSVAEVLADHGIEIALSCEQGVCGTCLTRVVDGVPDHRDVFMTAAEQARNDQFTPCCSRALSARLVIDLHGQ